MLRRLVSLGLVLRTMRGKLSAALGISRSSSYYQHVLPINDDELLVRITDVMRDNTAYGYQESFYGHFKLELGDLNRFEIEGELFEAIARQLYYYNHQRIHTAIKTNPVQYRKNYLAVKTTD